MIFDEPPQSARIERQGGLFVPRAPRSAVSRESLRARRVAARDMRIADALCHGGS